MQKLPSTGRLNMHTFLAGFFSVYDNPAIKYQQILPIFRRVIGERSKILIYTCASHINSVLALVQICQLLPIMSSAGNIIHVLKQTREKEKY